MAAKEEGRLDRLLQRFAERYPGTPKSEIVVVRAPGRVNLIGEHVDYSGFGVLPMAIEAAAWVACSLGPADTPEEPVFDFSNLNSSAWTDGSMSVARALDSPLDRSQKHWSHYLIAGIKGVCLESGFDGSETATAAFRSRGARFLVDSNVPPGSGLSSSSALLCAAALSIVETFSLGCGSTEKLAELCARAEHHVGSESGGMDQAISYLAKAGYAKHILFDPLRSLDVILPTGHVWVLVNSMVTHSVSDGGGYNMRVSECRLATAVLAKHWGFDDLLVSGERTLSTGRTRKVRLDDVLLAYAAKHNGKSLDPDDDLSTALLEMSRLSTEVLSKSSYTLADVAALLDADVGTVRARFVTAQIHADPEQLEFRLQQRAQHVFEEAARVYLFKSTTAAIERGDDDDDDDDDGVQITRLGELLTESHRSCRDLFECSCPELDKVVGICVELGALGSRLTGAGWGGWTVSLVPETKKQAFLESLAQQGISGAIVSAPEAGAGRIH